MFKKSLFAVLISSSIGTAFASDPFQYEVGGSYINTEFSNNYNVNGTYFLAPLSNGDGPYAEAAFLNRASSISGSFNRSELDHSTPFFSGVNSWSVGGIYQLEGTDFFIDGNVSRFNGDGEFSYRLGGGYYIQDDWSVSLSSVFDDDVEYLGTTIATKKIWATDFGEFVNLDVAYTNNDKGPDNYSVGADFYVTPRLGFGLAHSWFDDIDDIGDAATTFSVDSFVTETVRVSGNLTITHFNSNTEQTFGLAVAARF